MKPLPTLREVVAQYGLQPTKRLGQNFLFDPALLLRIAQSAGDLKDKLVLEIGPGPGGLTRALLELGVKQVIAIEQDERCLGPLHDLASYYPNRLQIIHGDARLYKLPQISPQSLKIVANLPYHLVTVLLLQWLENAELIESMTLLMQKEVALRLSAKPGTGEYGRLSVLTQWLCTVQRLFDIPPGAFYPPPQGHVYPHSPETETHCQERAIFVIREGNW